MLISELKKTYRRMPITIRAFTFVSLMLSLLLPVAIIPVGDYRIDGWPVSWEEFWLSGGGIIFCVIGMSGIIFSYGFICARRWVRILFPLAIAALGLLSACRNNEIRERDWIGLLFVSLFCGGYLFFHRATKSYFSKTRQTG